MTFQYSIDRRLTNITDTLDRPIAYRYDASGRLTNVTDFAARSLRFAYDANGNLISRDFARSYQHAKRQRFSVRQDDAVLPPAVSVTRDSICNLLSVTALNESRRRRLGAARRAECDATRFAKRRSAGVLAPPGTNASGVSAERDDLLRLHELRSDGQQRFRDTRFQNTVANRSSSVADIASTNSATWCGRFSSRGAAHRRIAGLHEQVCLQP